MIGGIGGGGNPIEGIMSAVTGGSKEKGEGGGGILGMLGNVLKMVTGGDSKETGDGGGGGGLQLPTPPDPTQLLGGFLGQDGQG